MASSLTESDRDVLVELIEVGGGDLFEFGPSRKSYHPEYPFWRLQNDGIWEVASDVPLSRKPNVDIPVTELRGLITEGAHSIL